MQAYLNNPKLKSAMLRQMTRHVKLDQLIKGSYGKAGEHFRGCAIGCALDSLNRIHKRSDSTGNHERFPAELGIPIELAYLLDHFFEQLPSAKSQAWPHRVLKAIPVGADLSGVLPAMLQWSILDLKYGWMTYAKTPAGQQTCRDFAALVAQDWALKDSVTNTQWNEIDSRMSQIEARAWAWAWAWARARARARAWAGAGAGADWYVGASEEVLRLIAETRTTHA